MGTLPRSELLAHLQFRRALLASAAECMFAALQLHVDGCPRCATGVCSDASHAAVAAIRQALTLDRMARAQHAAGPGASVPGPDASRAAKH